MTDIIEGTIFKTKQAGHILIVCNDGLLKAYKVAEKANKFDTMFLATKESNGKLLEFVL
ncbi:MAG: hypothetical protein ACYTFW_08260 [Planctomycetota bacterium]